MNRHMFVMHMLRISSCVLIIVFKLRILSILFKCVILQLQLLFMMVLWLGCIMCMYRRFCILYTPYKVRLLHVGRICFVKAIKRSTCALHVLRNIAHAMHIVSILFVVYLLILYTVRAVCAGSWRNG